MPRGIPNNKDSKATGAKAAAAKPATKPAVQTTQPQKAAIVNELSNPAIDAILKLEAHFKAALGGRPMHGYAQPFHGGHGGRLRNAFGHETYSNTYLNSVAASRRDLFPAQTATIYVKGEALASTTVYDILASSDQIAFTIEGKKHVFSYNIDSELYVDLTEYSGVLLAPVPEGVQAHIDAERAVAKASGEETLAIYLTTERAPLEVGNRVRPMLDDKRTFIVVEKHTQDRFGSNHGQEVFKDLTLVEVATNYSVDEGALPSLQAEPFRAYSGLFILAPTAK
jgi:hypothetical protein